MQNRLIKSLTYLGSAFALAAITGCNTVPTQTLKADGCMVGEEIENKLFLAFVFKANSPETYSRSCNEGRLAARTTYVAQDAKGNLHPTGALFALEYHKDVQEKIKTSAASGDADTRKFFEEVNFFFGFYLQKIGGQTIDKIQKYIDDLNSESPAAPAPKPLPRCVAGANSVIRSCAAEPKKEPTPQ